MTVRTAFFIAANAARWAARLLGTLLFLFLLAFFVGEGPPRVSNLSGGDVAALSGWIILGAGFLIAWKWEVAGGLMILAAVLWKGKIPAMWLLCLSGGIGLTHVLCAAVLRNDRTARWAPIRWSRYKGRVAAALGTAAGVVALLAANEMFGMPPVMTPELRPTDSIAGAWQADLGGGQIRLNIAKGGAVAGSIAGVPIAAAHLMRNRSWFGRLMNWRTEYIIVGDLSLAARVRGAEGDHFTVPANFASGQFVGTVFLGGRNNAGLRVAAKPIPSRIVLRRE